MLTGRSSRHFEAHVLSRSPSQGLGNAPLRRLPLPYKRTMFTAAAACAGSACCTATCSCFGAVGSAVARISARALYVFLFVLTTIIAVVLRDYAKPMLANLPWIVGVTTGIAPKDEWFGAQAVYRISLGSFLFFSALSLVLINVETKSDPRDRSIHHGNWLLKLCVWVLCLVMPFFLSADSGLITFYVWFARVASGFFLVAQSVILLDFAFLWNQAWVQNSEKASDTGDEKTAVGWIVGLLLSTITLYGGVIALTVYLYQWYVPSKECHTNAWIISISLILIILFTIASIHPTCAEKGASVLPAAVVAAYVVYLTHQSLASEPGSGRGDDPVTNRCVPAVYSTGGKGGGEAAELAGAALTLLSVAYSALRAGSADFFGDTDDGNDSQMTSLLDSGDNADDTGASGAEFPTGPTTYSYSFFHAVFALASAYLGMLLTGWGDNGFLVNTSDDHTSGVVHTSDITDIESGWASVWVKAVSAWITALLYSWTIAAPLIVEDRDFF